MSVIFFVVALTGGLNAQGAGSAREVLKHLASTPQGDLVSMMGLSPCYDERSARFEKLASKLVQIGPLAIPEVEATLDAIRREGPRSVWYRHAALLYRTYARLLGKGALPRLRLWRDTGRRRDGALAEALSVTGYVSSIRLKERYFDCDKGSGPKDTLERFILGVLLSDASWSATAFVEERREGIISSVFPSFPTTSRVMAVAFQIRDFDPWKNAEEIQEARFVLEVLLLTPRGQECGPVIHLAFSRSNSDLPFLIEDEDPVALSAAVAKCAQPE